MRKAYLLFALAGIAGCVSAPQRETAVDQSNPVAIDQKQITAAYSRTPASSAELRLQDIVVTAHGNFGRVTDLLSSETARVYFFKSSQQKVFARSSLAKITGCSGGFCVGEPVATQHDNPGLVTGIFESGDLCILFFKSESYQRRSPVDLSKI